MRRIIFCIIFFASCNVVACLDVNPAGDMVTLTYVQPAIYIKSKESATEVSVLAKLSINKAGTVTYIKIEKITPESIDKNTVEKAISKATFSGGPLENFNYEFNFEVEKIEI